ncbi:hypothetical protein D3C80_2019670 [compost metagenome]
MTQAVDQAEPAGVEDLLDRQWIEQAVGGRQRIAEQRQDKTGSGLVVACQVALVDPGIELLLPNQIGLQAPAVEGIEAP